MLFYYYIVKSCRNTGLTFAEELPSAGAAAEEKDQPPSIGSPTNTTISTNHTKRK